MVHEAQGTRLDGRVVLKFPSEEFFASPRARLYHADPLVCERCGGRLAIVAYITDEVSIRRILDHLGLSPPQQQRAPPSRELVRVPVDEEGREIQAG